jgi:hypothetical protein
VVAAPRAPAGYWLAQTPAVNARHTHCLGYLIFPATQFSAHSGIPPGDLPATHPVRDLVFDGDSSRSPYSLSSRSKEEIPAAIVCLGIWYALRGRATNRAVIVALGLGATLSLISVILI